MVTESVPNSESGGDQIAQLGSAFRTVKSKRLKVGAVLKFPIFDRRSVLLLADGQTLTPQFLEQLQSRGVFEVQVHESELPRIYAGQPLGTATDVSEDRLGHFCELENSATRQLDEELEEGQIGLPPQGEAFENELESHGATRYDEETREGFVDHHVQAVTQMEYVFDSLSKGQGLDVDALAAITDEVLAEMVQDSDLMTALGINPYSDKYPARHSMHVCMLAIAIGARLKLDRQTLKELAIGCLIHDAGMLKIDKRVYSTHKRLSRIEFLEITKHPVLVFDMMLTMQAVPARSAFIAYQIHERCNGNGYPRRRDKTQIHFLSKVAAVADHYVGLVSPRPYREALMPYHAIERVLHAARQGLFDSSAVRALLKTVSLFPIGSYVQLSDGCLGRVIRSNGDAYDSPIVEFWQPDDLDAEPGVVDLTETEVRVARALPSLEDAPNLPDEPSVADSGEHKLLDALDREEAASGDYSGQRKYERKPYRSLATVYVKDQDSPSSFTTYEAWCRNVSQGGLSFICRHRLPQGEVIVSLSPGSDKMCFRAQIVRERELQDGFWECGLSFNERVPEPA